MAQPLKLLSAVTVDRLLSNIKSNAPRYRDGDFSDLARESGWAIETTIARWDPSVSGDLDPDRSPQAEVKNSILIYRAFEGMTPALARDERIWARLTHVECLEYTRARWLRSEDGGEEKIRSHFFASGFTGSRDDNSIGRLWWNGHIAKLACPEDVELGLKRLLARANIRLQVIDRADTAFRQPLIRGIVRLLGDSWFESYDAAVADFMFEVNKRSGGIVFEALVEEKIDEHLLQCMNFAKLRKGVAASSAAAAARTV